ncbi:MAG: MT-A70 family methyltransferase [Hyphomonadaceae bacterium]
MAPDMPSTKIVPPKPAIVTPERAGIVLPAGKFSVILADPPWQFQTRSPKGRGRCPDAPMTRNEQRQNNPERHYKTMSIEEIESLPVADVAAKNCVLFLWAIDPMLPHALRVAEKWGFTYKTVAFYWVKTRRESSTRDLLHDIPEHKLYPMGTGYWTRSNPEQCLLFTRGKPSRQQLATAVRKLIVSPRREHSRKPDCVRDNIEQLCTGPYLELFARQSRPGWTTWGNEAEKFDAPPTAKKRARKPSVFSEETIDLEAWLSANREREEKRETPTQRVRRERSQQNGKGAAR